MKIEINIKIFLVLLICIILKNTKMYLIFLFFAFVHEIAHLVFGLCIGGKADKIKIEPYGISLVFCFNKKNKHLLKILFYLVGPISNLFFAILFMKNNIMNVETQNYIIYTNLLLFVFNLLPIIPLDGGKIMIEILKIIYKENFKVQNILAVSKLFLFIFSFLYSIAIIKVKNIYIFFLILYLWYLYYIEEKKILLYEKTIKIIDKFN